MTVPYCPRGIESVVGLAISVKLGIAAPVSEKLAGLVTPATLAVMVSAPVAVGCAVTWAWPLLLVMAVAPEGKLTPVPAKVTVTPEIGLLLASLTTTTSGFVKLDPTAAVCPDPDITATLAAVPAVPVSEKLAGVVTPATVAVMVSAPVAVGCAVTWAWPLLLVTAVAPEGKVTPVPANVTVRPETGLLLASFTTTTSGLGKLVPTGAVCPEPETTVTEVAGRVAGVTVTLAVSTVPSTYT